MTPHLRRFLRRVMKMIAEMSPSMMVGTEITPRVMLVIAVPDKLDDGLNATEALEADEDEYGRRVLIEGVFVGNDLLVEEELLILGAKSLT